MGVLKQYTVATDITSGEINVGTLTKAIVDSGFVTNCIGIESDRDETTFEVLGESITDEAALDALISGHIKESPTDTIKSQYKSHERAGKDFFDNYRADMVIKILSALITEDDALDLDIKLTNVNSNLKSGDWKTAKKHIESIAVDSIFTQEIKDDLIASFDDYIANNY